MTLTRVFCHYMLTNICLWWLLGNIECADNNKDSCKTLHGKPIHFSSCPKDCSQDDGKFNCSIGGLKELNTYNLNNGYQSDLLDPPHLLDIKFKQVIVEQHYTGSIEISFQLPKALKGRYPDAVQLYFQGMNKDDYYTRCPRQRVFQFHDYQPNYSKEGVHPRNISYSCFYGVDESDISDSKKGYRLGLKSNPGKWRNYTLTIDAVSLSISLYHWIPTIAVSLNVADKSLSVLVEKVPVDIEVSFKSVNLRRLDLDITIPNILNVIEWKTTFPNLAHGIYIVEVVIYGKLNGDNGNWTGESVEIDATSLPSEEYPLHYADYNVGPLKIFSMVGGCLIGLVLLVLLGITVYRHRTCRKESLKGFILHPFDDDSVYVFVEFIEQFGNLLESKCNCFLYPWKPVKLKSVSEIKQWLENDFNSLSFILVFYISDCYENVDINPNAYSQILNEAAKLNEKGQLHIIPIQLSRTVTLPSVISRISPVAWDELETIHYRMKGTERLHDKKVVIDQKWRSSRPGKSLIEIFCRLPTDTCVRNNKPNTFEDVPVVDSKNNPTQAKDIDCMKSFIKDFAMGLNRESYQELNESQIADDTRDTSLHSIQADVHMNSVKATVSINDNSPTTNKTHTDNSQGFIQKHPIEPINPALHKNLQWNSRVPSKRPCDQQVELSPLSGRFEMGSSYNIKPHEQFETHSGYHLPIPEHDGHFLCDLHMTSQTPAMDQYDQDVVYGDQDFGPLQPHFEHDVLHETSPLMERELHNGLFHPYTLHVHGNNHSHGYFPGSNSNSGHFHSQPLRMPLLKDQCDFHSPLTNPHSRNPMCERENMSPNMQTCGLISKRAQCRNKPSFDIGYDRIPEFQSEIILQSTHRSGADKKNDFAALDPRPEFSSRSNKFHIVGEPYFHPNITDECEEEDIRSVSQNDLSRTNFKILDTLTPPDYDYTSEESIKSKDQEEQLMKINKEASLHNIA